MIPAKQVDEIVWQDLCAVLTHPEVIEAALLRAQGGAWLPQELQARRENLRKAHLSVNQQIERLTEAYLAGIITLEELKRRRQDLAQRQEAVTSQVRQLEARAAQQPELAQVMSTIQEFCQRVQNGLEQVTFEQKRQLVELLIDRVIVSNEEVEIRYVIPIGIKLSTVPNRVPPTRVGRCWDGFGVAECDSPTSSHAQSNAKPVLPPLRIRQP